MRHPKAVVEVKTESPLDPEIEGVINDLNETGLKTVGSCAGHLPAIEGSILRRGVGFIIFQGRLRPEQLEETRYMLESSGLTNVSFKYSRAGSTIAEFTPIGERRD